MTRQHAAVAALCLGLALSNWLRLEPFLLVGALAASIAVLRAHPAFVLAAAALTLGLVLGGVRLSTLERTQLAAHVGESASARVTITGPVRPSAWGNRAQGRLSRFGEAALDERVWLELPGGDPPRQGAILELAAAVREPMPASDGGYDERTWLSRQGIHVVIVAEEWRQVGVRGGLAGVGDRLRGWLDRDMTPGLRGERRALIAGFVLGEDEGLSPELRDAFRTSGLYHLLAVSGSNIAFLVAAVLGLCWLLGISRLQGHAAALVVVFAYVLVVGWQPSVIRAAVAGSLGSLAFLAARPRDRWYFLLLGALILLVWNPASLLDPGFQLSFAAVLGIFLCVPRLERQLSTAGLPAAGRAVIAVSAACGVLTAPILLLEFGVFPLYGLVANVLVEPVVPLVMTLALVSALIAPVVPPAAVLLAWINGLIVAYIAGCARFVAAIPGAQIGAAETLGIAAAATGVILVRGWRSGGLALHYRWLHGRCAQARLLARR